MLLFLFFLVGSERNRSEATQVQYNKVLPPYHAQTEYYNEILGIGRPKNIKAIPPKN